MSKALSSKGQSASWSSQQKNVIRIFDLMAEDDEELSLLRSALLAPVGRGKSQRS